jgi:membrane protein
MSVLRKVPGVGRVQAAFGARARAAWGMDRTNLEGWAAATNRTLRILVMVIRGIVRHRLEVLAAALTYYTVFAIVPTLAVVLSAMRLADFLPASLAGELPAGPKLATGGDLIRASLRKILEAGSRTSEVATGLVGLAVLMLAITKMFRQTERALHIIASSGDREPRFVRLVGYLALLFMAPLALALSGLLYTLLSSRAGHLVMKVVGSWVELGLGTGLAFLVLWATVTVFYWSAVRARIPLRSAAVGGAVVAIALPVIFWVFVTFQVGVSSGDHVEAGMLAVAVFLLWAYASWTAVLIGAEIAVAHREDRILRQGVAAFALDGLGEIAACTGIMVCVARARAGEDVAEDGLAGALRLRPEVVRVLCARLAKRGLLVQGPAGYRLGCDPRNTDLAAIVDAAQRDPELDAARAEELARLPAPARAALSNVMSPPRREPNPRLAQLAEERA